MKLLNKKNNCEPNKKLIYSFIFLILIIVGCEQESNPNGLNIGSEKLFEFEFKEKVDLKIQEDYIFLNKNEKLKIEKYTGLSKESKKDLINKQFISIESAYSDSSSAYPGEISNTINCDEKFKPKFIDKKIDNVNYNLAIIYVSDRYGFGACTEDTVKFKNIIGWISCQKNEELYKLNYYKSVKPENEEAIDFITSFYCK